MTVPDQKPVKPNFSTRFQKGNKFQLMAERLGRHTDWPDEDIAEETQALKEWISDPKNYYFNSFLTLRGLHHEHVERFSQRNAEFCAMVKFAKAIMEQRLVDLAISKKGDGNFIKFVLANKSGWKERSEISGDSANPLALVLDKIAKQNQEPIQAQVIEPEQLSNQSPSQATEPKQQD